MNCTMKKILSFAVIFTALCCFCACEGSSSKGLAPKDISGKTVILSGCSRTIKFTSNSSGTIIVGNSGAADKVRYVRYKKSSADEAKIEFSWYDSDKSKSNPYALDEEASFTLTFATESTGIYGGTLNAHSWSYGKDKGTQQKNYSGKTFSVN